MGSERLIRANDPVPDDLWNDSAEFWNGPSPRLKDDDAGRILDPNDWVLDENGSRLYLPAVQEVDPPQITVNGWKFEACSNAKLGDCANISLTLRDAGVGHLDGTGHS